MWPYLNRAISAAFSARQVIAGAWDAGDVRSSLPGNEVVQLVQRAAARLDGALDHMMGVASGVFSFSELVREALALGADLHEEFMHA